MGTYISVCGFEQHLLVRSGTRECVARACARGLAVCVDRPVTGVGANQSVCFFSCPVDCWRIRHFLSDFVQSFACHRADLSRRIGGNHWLGLGLVRMGAAAIITFIPALVSGFVTPLIGRSSP